MRIAIVAPDYYPRTCGVGDHSARVVEQLIRAGHDAALFVPCEAVVNPDFDSVAPHPVLGGFPIVRAHRTAMALRSWKPDHVVLAYTPQLFDPWRFGTLSVVRLAAAVRGMGARLTLFAHELFATVTWRPDLLIGAVVQRHVFSSLLRVCDDVVVSTDRRLETVETIARECGARCRVRLIRIGAGALPPESVAPVAGRIGMFSTTNRGRRFDVVIGAFDRVAARDPAASLVIIGDVHKYGPRRTATVMDPLHRSRFSDRITCTGRLPLSAITAEVAKLSVFVHADDAGASTRSSTLPAALGAGVPVVALRGGETDPVFCDGENVSLTSDLTPDAFATAIERLLNDRTLAARIGAGGRALYDRELAWSSVVERLLG